MITMTETTIRRSTLDTFDTVGVFCPVRGVYSGVIAGTTLLEDVVHGPDREVLRVGVLDQDGTLTGITRLVDAEDIVWCLGDDGQSKMAVS